jgi:hypothetical protein
VEGTLLGVGVACVIAAIVAGRVKVVGVKFPPLASVKRQALLATFGFALIAASLLLQLRPQSAGPMKDDSTSTTGSLEIKADRAARISLDGQSVAELPAGGATRVEKLMPGEHLVQARSVDDKYEWHNTVVIQPQQQTSVSTDLAAVIQAAGQAEAAHKKELVQKYQGKWRSVSTKYACQPTIKYQGETYECGTEVCGIYYQLLLIPDDSDHGLSSVLSRHDMIMGTPVPEAECRSQHGGQPVSFISGQVVAPRTGNLTSAVASVLDRELVVAVKSCDRCSDIHQLRLTPNQDQLEWTNAVQFFTPAQLNNLHGASVVFIRVE